MKYGFIVLAFIAVIIFSIFFARLFERLLSIKNESEKRAAGRYGEQVAASIIKSVLKESDVLLNNIALSFDGKDTELDNVIINQNGIFIIEVKNYNGTLSGGEDDYEWIKHSISRGGNTYVKAVKNPIKQVKRQVYILAKHLEYYGIDVWVQGYAFFIDAKCPVQSNYVLNTDKDIDEAIHKPSRVRLNKKAMERIKEVL
ncbi:MAG: NERD domain-containing protein [Clostridia bacterium]|nr:NERD domain-containing protein [Clostridia bacterium]